jgi:hypothetical protein
VSVYVLYCYQKITVFPSTKLKLWVFNEYSDPLLCGWTLYLVICDMMMCVCLFNEYSDSSLCGWTIYLVICDMLMLSVTWWCVFVFLMNTLSLYSVVGTLYLVICDLIMCVCVFNEYSVSLLCGWTLYLVICDMLMLSVTWWCVFVFLINTLTLYSVVGTLYLVICDLMICVCVFNEYSDSLVCGWNSVFSYLWHDDVWFQGLTVCPPLHLFFCKSILKTWLAYWP